MSKPKKFKIRTGTKAEAKAILDEYMEAMPFLREALSAKKATGGLKEAEPRNKEKNDFFCVAGELAPNSFVTNMALMKSCQKEMRPKKIIITSAPDGPGIPEKIRMGWIGATMISEGGPFILGATSIIKEGNSDSDFIEGYVVKTTVAIISLKKVNTKISIGSHRWFSKRKLPRYLIFNKKCCRVVV